MRPLSTQLSVLEFVWLALQTASAAALSSYVLDRNSVPLSWSACFGLHVIAWAVVVAAWSRWYHGKGRHAFECTVSCAIVVMIGASVRSEFFPCPVRPEMRQYLSLTSAVQNGKLAEVKAILTRDRQPDYTPPLPMACNSDMACWYESKTPLYLAVQEDNTPIAATLLEHGASASPPYQDLLVLAAGNGDIGMMRVLLQHGARLNYDGGLSPALSEAITNNHKDAAAFLLTAGANSGDPHAGAHKP